MKRGFRHSARDIERMTKRWWYGIYRDGEDKPVSEGEVVAETRAIAERKVLRLVPDEDHGILLQQIIDEGQL